MVEKLGAASPFSGTFGFSSIPSFSDGTTTHLTYRKDGDNYQLIYDADTSSPEINVTYTGGWTTSENVYIGSDDSSGINLMNSNLDAFIDEMYIYDRALSNAEIQTIYNEQN